MIEGWYYLHTNGDLIYKHDFDGIVADIRESPFAVALWPVDPTDRENAWTIAIEASAAGARESRIKEISEKWGLTDEDASVYAERIGVLLGKDGDQITATRKDFTCLQESPAGFGDNALSAMAALAVDLGYKPCKMWGKSFTDFVKEGAL